MSNINYFEIGYDGIIINCKEKQEFPFNGKWEQECDGWNYLPSKKYTTLALFFMKQNSIPKL